MIGLLGRMVVALAVVVPVAWGGVLWGSGGAGGLMAGSIARLEAAFGSSRERERMLGDAVERVAGLGLPLGAPGEEGMRLLGAAMVVTLLHGSIAGAALPFTLGLGLAGASAGLVFRERLRDASGYASPWAAGLGRVLLGAGGFWLGLFGLSPVPLPLGWVYLSPAALFLGALLHSANLPPKL